jgi:translation initiation factor 5
MSLLNIGGDKNDASYRYKMPKLVRKIEGRGNGIKTVVMNMVDIAKALHMPAGYPTKFFGIELGAQSQFNATTERAIVNGAHDAHALQEILEKFIDIFVLCPTCHLPEIKQKVKKTSIKIDCAACGHNGVLKTSHKLVTYILNHPPNKDKKGKKDKKDKQSKAERRKNKSKEANGEAEATGEKKEKKEKKEVEWFTDTSKEAQAKRKQEEFQEMATRAADSQATVDAIMASAKSENKMESPVTLLKIFLTTKPNCSVDEITGELRRLELSRGLDEPQKIKVLLEAIIDVSEVKKVPAQFKKHSKLLGKVAKDNNTSTILIGCIEDLVGVVEPKLLKWVPVILQALYEEDVLDEDVILAWHESPPESSWLVNKEVATSVREKALPFITWLKEAESDDDEE